MEKKSLILNVNEAFISEFEKEKNFWNIRSSKYKDRNSKKANLEQLEEKIELSG